ncbi:phage tail tape measure protein [Azotobacter vinelandii]
MAEQSAKLNFILRLTDQVTAPLAKVKAGFAELAGKGQAHIAQMGVGLAGLVGSALSIDESLAPALEMNRTLAEVRSLGVAEQALDNLQRKALSFSMAYGESAREFVASAYDIQGAISGLVGSELATFTEASAIMAKATKASATTMSDYVGTMYGIFQNQADAMGKSVWIQDLAGQTAYALNIFKTTGEGMSEAFSGLGASATSAGISLTEQMAILGTLQATMSGSEAGTKYKAFLNGVGQAQKELGLSFADTHGRLLPMMEVLEKIVGKFGTELTLAESDTLKKAFGSDEAVDLIKLLMTNVGGLGDSIAALGKIKGMDYAVDMAKVMVDPWQRAAAAVEALRIAFGQTLVPILTPLMERLAAIAGTLTRWIKLFPNIARWLGIVTLGVLGLVGATAGLTILGGLFGTLALLVSPIALIVLGIGLLVAAVAGAILWWDTLKARFGDTGWFRALTALVEVGAALFGLLAPVLRFVWNGLQQIWSMGVRVVEWLGSLDGVIATATAAWNGFLDILNTYGPFTVLRNALGQLIWLLNKIPGIEIDVGLSELPSLPAGTTAPSTPAVDRALGRALPATAAETSPLVLTAPSVQPPAPVALPQPVVQAAPPLVLAAPAVQPPAPVALPQPAVQAAPPLVLAAPAVQSPAPVALPQPVMQAAPPLALAAPAVQPPAPIALPQPVVQAAPPLVLAAPTVQPPAPVALPQPVVQAAPPLALAAPAVQPPAPIALPQLVVQAAPPLVLAPPPTARAEQARERINAPLASLAPQRPGAVPPGGLLTSIQNTTHQNRGTHVEKVEIHTGKPMSPLELENMLSMAVGG